MIFDTLDDCFDFVAARRPYPIEALCAAVKEKNHPAAYAALRKLGVKLSGKRAGECLCAALDCTPKLFGEILERCEPGEYAASRELSHPEQKDRSIRVNGTILTLAAALDRPRHAELLLKRGWDANSASPASVQALFDADGGGMMSDRANAGMICGWNDLKLLGTDWEWEIEHVTPFAAATAFGSARTARLLLAHGCAKELESTAVCRAAIVALHGTRAQRACLRLALGLNSAADDYDGMARELLTERAPDIADIADLCTPDEFALRLSGEPCAPDRLFAAVKALTPISLFGMSVQGADEKLDLLLNRYPELEMEQRVRDMLLNACLRNILAGWPCDKLLTRWKAACGAVRDISAADDTLIRMETGKGPRALRQDLGKLGEGGSLRISSESDWFSLPFGNARNLSVLLDCADVYPEADGHVSTLARTLLIMGDVRLLRKAAERGVLRGESREKLMEFLSGVENAAPYLRALVLAIPNHQIGTWSARPLSADGEVWQRWKQMELMERCDYLRQMWEEPLGVDECKMRLRLGESSSGGDAWMLSPWNELDGMQISNMRAAACCGRNPELLRALLESGKDPRQRARLSWTLGVESMTGTMLCLAAAAGRTEQARLLLDAGIDPNEDDVPERSVYRENELFGETRVVTPLYMALSRGQYETAALLRSRGGYAYPDI